MQLIKIIVVFYVLVISFGHAATKTDGWGSKSSKYFEKYAEAFREVTGYSQEHPKKSPEEIAARKQELKKELKKAHAKETAALFARVKKLLKQGVKLYNPKQAPLAKKKGSEKTNEKTSREIAIEETKPTKKINSTAIRNTKNSENPVATGGAESISFKASSNSGANGSESQKPSTKSEGDQSGGAESISFSNP